MNETQTVHKEESKPEAAKKGHTYRFYRSEFDEDDYFDMTHAKEMSDRDLQKMVSVANFSMSHFASFEELPRTLESLGFKPAIKAKAYFC